MRVLLDEPSINAETINKDENGNGKVKEKNIISSSPSSFEY